MIWSNELAKQGGIIMRNEKYLEGLRRNYSEVTFAHHEYFAYTKMWQDSPTIYPNEFLGLCSMALFNDMVAHLIKVLERNSKALTFWNIRSRNKKQINEILKKSSCNLSFLKNVSDKLRDIRNHTHFHIDTENVSNPKEVWKKSGLKNLDIKKTIVILLEIFGCLYKEQVSTSEPFLSYDGEDAPEIIRIVKKPAGGE